MKVIGVDLGRRGPAGEPGPSTLVSLRTDGSVESARHAANIPGVADVIHRVSAGEPFLVGVNAPIVIPDKPARARPVENVVRRRFGHRLRPGGRGAFGAESAAVAGEALLAGLAAAGHPCLPYPDRDRRASGLAEIHPELSLKALLWETSSLSRSASGPQREELFRSLSPPTYRAADSPKRSTWAERATSLDMVIRSLTGLEGYDLRPAREALQQAQSDRDAERAGSILDATLVAGTARRYLEAPEACLFLGDREQGYVIMPADGFIRRLALRDARPRRGQLFPKTSLRERLEADAEIHSLELLTMEGHPQRIEARFHNRPLYEFDNLDEMLWWKHCRHLDGPTLPTEGLQELTVQLQSGSRSETPLRLSRSRHRVLSFRFDPPAQWRRRLPTRDGATYAFRVLRAAYDTLPANAGRDSRSSYS